MRYKWQLRIWGIGLGVLAILLRTLISTHTGLVESIYSRGLFQAVRILLDYTFGLLPTGAVLPLLVISAAGLVITVSTILKHRKSGSTKPWPDRIFKGCLNLLALAGCIVFLFYFLWGFNYQRSPVENHLRMEPIALDVESIRRETAAAFTDVRQSRKLIASVGDHALDAPPEYTDLENSTRDSLIRVLYAMDYPAAGRPRIRSVTPSGLMMRFSISGLYFPFTGESYIPKNLTIMEQPFSMAHELAHAYGFTEEGTANFLAFLACTASPNPLIRYSGHLSYFNILCAELARLSPGECQRMLAALPAGIAADRRAIQHSWARYRGWFTKLGYAVNDAYLKSQGIRNGILSYNRALSLIIAWKNRPVQDRSQQR